MPSDNPATPKLMSRALFFYFVSAFGSMMSFYLLLSVVPLFATSAGVGRTGAGLTTGALMVATVVAELATPALLARLGYRTVLSAGLVLLGAPALALTASTGFITILVVCLIRGIGLAILVVAGSALVATLVAPERRSEGLGLLGVVVGVPAVVALPLGVWLAERVGFGPVFVAGAAASLACLVVIPALPGTEAGAAEPIGVLEGLRMPGQTRPALIFLLSAMGTGILVTFLPLAMREASHLAALVLLVNTISTTAARWWAGRYASRFGQARLLVGGVITAAIGMLALAFIGNPAVVGLGAISLGIGFGLAQNSSLALMFERAPASGYDMVSAVWNLAYDAGLGVGAAGFGVIVVRVGFSGAFAIAGGIMLAPLMLVWLRPGWQQ
jgi:predicted MFS family arabinose efflux permease